MRTKTPNQPPAAWPEFELEDPSSKDVRNRPKGGNVVRPDARTEWHDFGELSVYRYILDYTPRVHMW